MLIRVALPVPLPQNFDYYCPQELGLAVVGARVLVPFGRRKLVGVVAECNISTALDVDQIKPVLAILDQENLFTPSLWTLLLRSAEYYHAPLGEMLVNALPVKLRNGDPLVQNQQIYYQITPSGEDALKKDLLKSSPKQLQALKSCYAGEIQKEQNDFTAQIWRTLRGKGFIQEVTQTISPIPWQNFQTIVKAENVHLLNKDQSLALQELVSTSGFNPWLLYGVTGSGKTEVYLQFLAHILEQGKQALVLVPEISLTPQTVRRFQERFNVPVEMLHSQMNDSERLKIWCRIRRGESAILIGTRSALFTPFQNLGAIIVDEEHDRSFKQQEGVRYHARDLAVMYGKIANIPVILGSATPSLETLHNVQVGKYKELQLNQRAGDGKPLHHFMIDMQKQVLKKGISLALINKIEEHLQAGNQVLLFLNRRGFAPVLLCHECGWVATCHHCDKPFTYHQKDRILRCHHCGMQKPLPHQCDDCGSTYLVHTGLGTEQLEKNLRQLFPDTLINRIDRDSVSRKGALEKSLNLIHQHSRQILIGTQMLAKGHHFPEVTLVAMLNIDNALFASDFRAEEQLAQLYVQVAGRGGRAGKKGEVVLQTYYPQHKLLQTLLMQGYNAFADQALHQRKLAGLPPHKFQALFHSQSAKAEDGEELLLKISKYFANLNIPDLEILPVMPAPMAKKANVYRWHFILQHRSRPMLQKALQHFPMEEFLNHKVRWYLDIDPLDFN